MRSRSERTASSRAWVRGLDGHDLGGHGEEARGLGRTGAELPGADMHLGALRVEGVAEEGHDLAGVLADAAHVVDDHVAHALVHGLGQEALQPGAELALEMGADIGDDVDDLQPVQQAVGLQLHRLGFEGQLRALVGPHRAVQGGLSDSSGSFPSRFPGACAQCLINIDKNPFRTPASPHRRFPAGLLS